MTYTHSHQVPSPSLYEVHEPSSLPLYEMHKKAEVSPYVCTITVCMYMFVCLSGLWLGGLLYLYFLSDFLKLVCYAHVFHVFTIH